MLGNYTAKQHTSYFIIAKVGPWWGSISHCFLWIHKTLVFISSKSMLSHVRSFAAIWNCIYRMIYKHWTGSWLQGDYRCWCNDYTWTYAVAFHCIKYTQWSPKWPMYCEELSYLCYFHYFGCLNVYTKTIVNLKNNCLFRKRETLVFYQKNHIDVNSKISCG